MDLNFKGRQIYFHPSWSDFITSDITQEIKNIANCIGEELQFTPTSGLVFRFLRFDLEKLKVCILGQDPYPQPGAATGRAFEDNRVISWHSTGGNASLRNILKLLHKHNMNANKVSKIVEIRKEITDSKFKILGPDMLFDHWEKQGVLLLNTALTCEIGSTKKSNSHSLIWAFLTKKLLKYIDNKKTDCSWFLWGKQAQEYSCLLKNPKKLYLSMHPSRNSEAEGSFFYENNFGKIREINWIN